METTKEDMRAQNHTMLVLKLGINSQQASLLQLRARSLDRLHLNACNYGLTERQETRNFNIMAEVHAMATANGFHAQEQGDPRGWPLIVSTEPIKPEGGALEDRVCPF